ncbi:MAG: 1-acyl-sn-glycerol-3-phosphate acyltransferase [Opitutales bacterium]|nr:1-acyl-sn-glycerol-3-phosphate acyltransferase [Opitutales bacterium]
MSHPRHTDFPPAHPRFRPGYYFLLLFFGAGALAFNVCAAARICFPHNERTQERTRTVVRTIFRIYMRMLTASKSFRYTVDAETHSLEELRGTLVVANHPGMLDAPMLFARIPRAICFFKASMHWAVVSGAGARLSGYIPNNSGIDGIREAVNHLASGGNVIVFPEGTRSPARALGPFRAGYGLIAKQAQCPVLCLLIETNSNVLGKGQPLWQRPLLPAHFRIRTILETLPRPGEPVSAFSDRIEASYHREWRPPAYTEGTA